MDLQTRIKDVSPAYKRYATRLEKLGIKTLEDFLYHIPFRYQNYSLISAISNVQPEETVTLQGEVADIKNQYITRWRTLQKAKVTDGTGTIEVTWFNQPYLLDSIKNAVRISISGKIGKYKSKITMQSPDYEIIYDDVTIHTGRLVPVYPETRGISSKWLRRQIYQLLKTYRNTFTEYLPQSIIKTHELLDFQQAISQIHFPDTPELADRAKLRLSFDELLFMQLAAIQRRNQWNKTYSSNSFLVDKFQKQIEAFWRRLPFELTAAQKRTIEEIFRDLTDEKPMNRLLEGDVGSGKTVVAAVAMFLAYLNDFQSVLMAPTEILVQQHFKTITGLLSPFGIKVGIATSGKKTKTKFDVMVGTHAVLSKKIDFNNLGLVVIDEQQRFGVEQRALIRKRGKNPHLLTMTATPIPRTIALTMYGDLDLSVLDEMPKGRRNIKTWLVPPEKRPNAYRWIEKQILETKSQAFIVCPFIEESENMKTVKAATREYEHLKRVVFPNLKLGLLHGKLKSKEKENILNQFRDMTLDILVATPVVEVGIDFPNATVIVIEGSERFGLAQLHQLRGRVGRGDKQSYCLLFTESKNLQTIQKLKAMEKLSVGSQLAELDLKLRGIGELYGTMQHGAIDLKIADFSNLSLIHKTRIEAEKIFSGIKNYPLLSQRLKKINTKQVSPD